MDGKILITGATGFIGRALVARATLDGLPIRIGARRRLPDLPAGVEYAPALDLAHEGDWSVALDKVRTVVHLAARVHVMRDPVTEPLAEFRRVNVAGTLRLARQAAAQGVARFIFVSSIKVNGEGRHMGDPYTAEDEPAPIDAYGVSKHEAELGLMRLREETGLEIIIIRPVLVYGPGVRGNFFSMLHWLHRGLPVPLGAVNNKRSLVALDNLVDLILICLHHAKAANQTFLVSDGEDLSTPELIRRVAWTMSCPVRLFRVPPSLLMAGATLLGRRLAAQRLLESLQVDISKTRQLLGWVPRVSVDEALRQTVDSFLQEQAATR